MEQFVAINKAVNGFVWGPVMLALLVGTGVYLSVAVGFIQFSKIGYWWKNTIGKIFKKGEAGDGEITPLQAVSTALASTVARATSRASQAPSFSAAPARCSGCGSRHCLAW